MFGDCDLRSGSGRKLLQLRVLSGCGIADPASARRYIARDLVRRQRQMWLIVGVWIEPVTAQVMMTLPRSGILFLPLPSPSHNGRVCTRGGATFCGTKSAASGSAIID
jgi:hypothetical protein